MLVCFFLDLLILRVTVKAASLPSFSLSLFCSHHLFQMLSFARLWKCIKHRIWSLCADSRCCFTSLFTPHWWSSRSNIPHRLRLPLKWGTTRTLCRNLANTRRRPTAFIIHPQRSSDAFKDWNEWNDSGELLYLLHVLGSQRGCWVTDVETRCVSLDKM